MNIGQELLAGARESQDLALASVLMEDFSELTANQCKRLTMATQVNVLKLEKELEQYVCCVSLHPSLGITFLTVLVLAGSGRSSVGCASLTTRVKSTNNRDWY